ERQRPGAAAGVIIGHGSAPRARTSSVARVHGAVGVRAARVVAADAEWKARSQGAAGAGRRGDGAAGVRSTAGRGRTNDRGMVVRAARDRAGGAPRSLFRARWTFAACSSACREN